MNEWHLRQLPVSIRLVLSCFLLITGAGYLLGVANIYYSHHAADADPKLTLNDVRAVYSGLKMQVKAGQAVPSRMLEMVDTKMREFLKTEADYAGLRAWLVSGSNPETFKVVAAGAEKSPQDIISDSCIRCHIPDGEKGQEKAHKAPFAADLFGPADYQMVSKYTGAPVDQKTAATHSTTVGPQSIEHLVLVGHVHMLTIPVFVLVTSLMVLFTGLRGGLRDLLIAVPMISLVFDFAAWWLARKWAWMVFLVVGSGPVFGLFFAAQILVVTLSMWFGRTALSRR